ncbi:MAG: hypothetical protein Q7S33_03830 [Nanoarchaeota archaeon]|nr:hypothetical protein [Nanoarchaeota archaeon]
MVKYTTSVEADKKIEQDLEIIKKIILEKFKPISIVMFGGFGHGAGSFKKIKNKIIPLNDYDLYLITENKISDEELEKAGEECSKALGRGGIEFVENFEKTYDENNFFHVDLHCLEYKKLKKLYPTQRSFDLKTSLVIYGDKDILNQIPEIKISKSDAIRLLFNKLDHFAIAENNSEIIKSIYAVKGFNDLCSAILISKGIYVSSYEERAKIFEKLDDMSGELKKLVKKATDSKLNNGYEIKDTDKFFNESKKWVEWTLKKIIKEHLRIDSDDWNEIAKIMYKKLPYSYFNDYLGSKYLFFGQYYLNIKFFLSAIRKNEFLPKSLIRWRDSGLIIAISLMLYSFKQEKGAEKYLKKLTRKTNPLRERILKLYSIYYLQKLV